MIDFAGLMRCRVRSTYDEWGEITHQHHARNHQTQHSQTDQRIWIAVSEGHNAKR